MNTQITEEAAIRRAIREGASGDFCDVSEIVKNRFGVTAGSGLVEKVYHQLQQAQEVFGAEDSSNADDLVKLQEADFTLGKRFP